jgi:hypothetical protein
MSPLDDGTDGRAVAAGLRTAATRLGALGVFHVATALGTSLALLSIAGVIVWPSRTAWMTAAALLLLGAVWWWRRRVRWSTPAAALAWERACPESRNVIVTAAELLAHRERSSPMVRARVFADARRVIEDADVTRAVPVRGAMAAGVLALAFAVGAAATGPWRVWNPPPAGADGAGTTAGGSRQETIHATITPPPYVASKPQSLPDPQRIDAIEGSRLLLEIRSPHASWRVRFGSRAMKFSGSSATPTVETTLAESGYFAVEDLETGTSRLIPVVVVPDRAPAVRIETPGKDLFVPDAKPTIRVKAAASDDHGLSGLELRYTKVSGSGEQFEFEEGTLPLQTEHRSRRDWTGTGSLPLARLAVGPGDALVYRVVARDARPGDVGLASSETFFVEVAGPGQVAVEGFELPPDRERYALSQQMIVLKIQRLRARERGLTRDGLTEATAGIAAEQRAVRSNFIFLLGGHVEDELEEAEHSHEIQEGRLENTARREINQAIQHMSRAEQALVAIRTADALTEARLAVQALQRAFGRNRYILRTLPVRSRLDPSRRLTGDLAAAAGWTRNPAEASPDPRSHAARRTLATLLAIAPSIRRGDPAARDSLARLAEDALRAGPAESSWQDIFAALLEVRDAAATAAPSMAVDRVLGKALALVTAETQRDAIPPRPDAQDEGVLHGAWTAERRPR